MGPTEILPHHFGGDGHVHRAEQRQPAIGRIAKRRKLAEWIDNWFFAARVNRPASAEAGSDDALARVARANGAHHVVAATGADEDFGAQAESLGCRSLQAASGLITGHQRR